MGWTGGGGGDVKGEKKTVQNDKKKNSVCCTPHLRNHTSFDCHLWCTYVN